MNTSRAKSLAIHKVLDTARMDLNNIACTARECILVDTAPCRLCYICGLLNILLDIREHSAWVYGIGVEDG